MELCYILADPSGNTTALVLSPVPRSRYGAAARRVMEALGAEQVAFVHEGRMDMMGGEFCGNASRSFALWQGLHTGDGRTLRPFSGELRQTVQVSGAPEPLSVLIRGRDGVLSAAIGMPLPRRVLPLEEGPLGSCTLVEYPGISHLLLEGREPLPGDREAADALLSQLGAGRECFGLLYLQGERMRPLVYVRETGTAVWESSCASGTCAVAAARALAQGRSLSLELAQPGGSLKAEATLRESRLSALTLDGPVSFPRAGSLKL